MKDKQPNQMGDAKRLLLLCAPILLTTFSSYFFIFIEKLLIVRISLQAMEAAVNAAYACRLFQMPCLAVVTMAQVYVGQWYGAQQLGRIGPGIWQFIWFSLFSVCITWPVSWIFGYFYFGGTAIEEIAMPYYHFMSFINFLFPLVATLSCFYLGQGKTRLVLVATLSTQLLKVTFAYLFIFGWGIIPAFGLLGGPLSTLLSQAVLVAVLFTIFLKSKEVNPKDYAFKLRLFWESIQPGLLRACASIVGVGCWVSIAQLMASRGGDYLLILSIGGSLYLFLPFLGDALCQAEVSIAAQMIGKKEYHRLAHAFLTSVRVASVGILIPAIPLVVFPVQTFDYLFPSIILEPFVMRIVFLSVWVSFVCYTFSLMPLSHILAFKDTKFVFFMSFFAWVSGFLVAYFAIDTIGIPPLYFWLVNASWHCCQFLGYFLRMRWLERQSVPVPQFREPQRL